MLKVGSIDLAVVLSGARKTVKEQIFLNMSGRVADLTRDLIESLDAVLEQNVGAAQIRIVETTKKNLD
ncbi:MAG TPA: hypothetical protein DIU35_16445 [Candidatus Latescibacteria bacterium]|nr:hypothetical protein [Gemmatimonadota bacterium]HCR19069.1 hypothetical protein [Candidatus Latescibacterota bacterium]